MGIVPVIGRVLDVGGRNRDTTLSLFRGLVDRAILEELRVALLGLTLGDGCCEGCLHIKLESKGQLERKGRMPFRDRRGQWFLSQLAMRVRCPNTATYRC